LDEARPSLTLSSDTKNDLPAKGVEDSSLKQKKMGQMWTHGHAHWLTHGRSAGGRNLFFCGRRKREREKWGCVWII